MIESDLQHAQGYIASANKYAKELQIPELSFDEFNKKRSNFSVSQRRKLTRLIKKYKENTPEEIVSIQTVLQSCQPKKAS